MMAMVSAAAVRVSESEVGRLWRLVGDAIDCIIPVVLVAAVLYGWGWVLLHSAAYY